MHRKHERRGEAGEEQIRHLVVPPVAVRAAPAERENPVEKLLDLGGRAIAQCAKVGNQIRCTKRGPRP